MGKDQSNRAKIGRWLRKFIFAVDETTPIATQIKLVHRSANGKIAEVQTFKPSVTDEESLKALVEEINGAMGDDAEGLSGMQNYVILAMNEGAEVMARLALRCMVDETADDDDSVVSEPANAKGLLSQLMRHNEAQARMLSGAMGTVLRAQQQMIEVLGQTVEKYAGRDLEMINTREELLSKKHERDMQLAEQEQNSALKGELLQKFLGLIAPIAKKLMGGKLSAEESLEVQELRTIYRDMSDAEMEGLKATLSPERYIALMSIIESDMEKQIAVTDGVAKSH